MKCPNCNANIGGYKPNAPLVVICDDCCCDACNLVIGRREEGNLKQFPMSPTILIGIIFATMWITTLLIHTIFR
jgi:hypothetical protein